MQECMTYLVYQKEFMMKHNIWKNKKNLENMKEIITEFKERISVEVKKQEKSDRVE